MFTFFSKINSRQENRSKLSFTARIITKYYLERFLSICGEKMSEGFLKFCKLISKLILGQIIVSNLTNINYARLHCFLWLVIKKQTSNTIITQAYHSRCSSWKVSSKASIASDFSTLLRIKQDKKRKRCHPRISDFHKRHISQSKPNKQITHEQQKTPDSSWISFCTSSGKRQLKTSQVHTKLCQLQLSK